MAGWEVGLGAPRMALGTAGDGHSLSLVHLPPFFITWLPPALQHLESFGDIFSFCLTSQSPKLGCDVLGGMASVLSGHPAQCQSQGQGVLNKHLIKSS